MRVMVLVKASEESEAGRMPSGQELDEMGKFNEELAKAGMMLAGDGLHPSAKGARVSFDGDEPEVTEGPFGEARALVAGYWVWQVESMAEAIEWAKRAPFKEGEVELRPIFEPDDFGEAFTPELREREEALREQIEGKG